MKSLLEERRGGNLFEKEEGKRRMHMIQKRAVKTLYSPFEHTDSTHQWILSIFWR
jgi:hypothetical protein